MRENLIVTGPIQITREERFGEPVIRVFVGNHQALKFDCFKHRPHFHIDPDGRDEVHPIISQDSLRWTACEIREHLGELLRQAGYPHAAAELRHATIRAKVEKIGSALGV